MAGLVAGVLLTYHRFGTAEQRWAALLGLVLLPIAGLAPLVERHILRLSPPDPEARAVFERQRESADTLRRMTRDQTLNQAVRQRAEWGLREIG